MIFDILLRVCAIIANFILSPILNHEDAQLPTELVNAMNNVVTFYNTISPLFPIGTLLAIIGIIVMIEVAIFIYKGVYWLIKKIPTIS